LYIAGNAGRKKVEIFSIGSSRDSGHKRNPKKYQREEEIFHSLMMRKWIIRTLETVKHFLSRSFFQRRNEDSRRKVSVSFWAMERKRDKKDQNTKMKNKGQWFCVLIWRQINGWIRIFVYKMIKVSFRFIFLIQHVCSSSTKQNVLPFIYPQKRYTVWLTTIV
jgi:hypothetical protein